MKSLIALVAAFAAIFVVGGAALGESKAVQGTLEKLKATDGAYEFAIIGDNRSGDRVYKKLIKGVVLRNPLFVVNTGDLIPNPGNVDQWRNFWDLSKPITVPYFPAVGNHDVDDEKSMKTWEEQVDLPGNEAYYSFMVGKDLFVVLNTCEPASDRRITGRQLAWLEKTLNSDRYRHQFVFMHHPLFLWREASHYGESLDLYPKDRDRLHDLFIAKKVDAVFLGHEHTYKRMPVGGVEYVVTGGGGAPLYSGFNNFMTVGVDGDRIAAKVIDREGYLRDEFLIVPK